MFTLLFYIQTFFVQVFKKWNKTELESFLIEITGDILEYHDSENESLVDKIVDKAGQVCCVDFILHGYSSIIFLFSLLYWKFIGFPHNKCWWSMILGLIQEDPILLSNNI
jgi:6-phosphogluconate dehydrogenase, C-terminal domain